MRSLTAQVLANAQGWEALDFGDLDALDDDQRAQLIEVADVYRACFETDAGQRVLEWMIDDYIVMQRVVDPESSGKADGIRQGQQDVVRKILSLIAIAHSGGQQRF